MILNYNYMRKIKVLFSSFTNLFWRINVGKNVYLGYLTKFKGGVEFKYMIIVI